MNELLEKINEARFVFICGNGGSASTAEHFTNDLFSKGIKAFCLSSNTSIMTMIANDYSYAGVYSQQLDVYASSQDLLITISCSGTSKNIKEAIWQAQVTKMSIYQFKTFDKNDKVRDFGKLEDEHLQLVHRIKDLLI